MDDAKAAWKAEETLSWATKDNGGGWEEKKKKLVDNEFVNYEVPGSKE